MTAPEYGYSTGGVGIDPAALDTYRHALQHLDEPTRAIANKGEMGDDWRIGLLQKLLGPVAGDWITTYTESLRDWQGSVDELGTALVDHADTIQDIINRYHATDEDNRSDLQHPMPPPPAPASAAAAAPDPSGYPTPAPAASSDASAGASTAAAAAVAPPPVDDTHAWDNLGEPNAPPSASPIPAIPGMGMAEAAPMPTTPAATIDPSKAVSPLVVPGGLTDGSTRVQLPDGRVVVAPTPRAAAAVRAALTTLGTPATPGKPGTPATPYVWGGNDPRTGLDCSGLTKWAYSQTNPPCLLPRSACHQNIGPHIPTGAEQPGDLAIWSDHVAMVIGDGQMIESPVPGKTVHLTPIRTTNEGEPFYGFYRPTGGDTTALDT